MADYDLVLVGGGNMGAALLAGLLDAAAFSSLAVMPMLPALFTSAITPARRMAMATLMVAALATAAGIDWGDALDVNGHRVLVIILYVAVLAVAGRNLLVPSADKATSPDRIGLTERFTPHQISEAEHALGVRL